MNYRITKILFLIFSLKCVYLFCFKILLLILLINFNVDFILLTFGIIEISFFFWFVTDFNLSKIFHSQMSLQMIIDIQYNIYFDLKYLL